jgi:hypothetical protein
MGSKKSATTTFPSVQRLRRLVSSGAGRSVNLNALSIQYEIERNARMNLPEEEFRVRTPKAFARRGG